MSSSVLCLSLTAHYFLSPHSIKMSASTCQCVSCLLMVPDWGMVYHSTLRSSLYTDAANDFYPTDIFASCHIVFMCHINCDAIPDRPCSVCWLLVVRSQLNCCSPFEWLQVSQQANICSLWVRILFKVNNGSCVVEELGSVVTISFQNVHSSGLCNSAML